MPTLKINDSTYDTDDQKANLFSSILHETFSMSVNNQFDEKFKNKV
jgi:hypothetical protein